MTDDKVTMSEAARLVGVHFNTLRNWRKAGRLTSAEKVIEKGVEVWIVSLAEVEEIARQSRNLKSDNNQTTDSPHNADYSPGFEQSLALIRESVVKPLTDVIERQSARLEEMAEEIGQLKERVRQLEQNRQQQDITTQSVPEAASEHKPEPIEKNKPAERKRRWWQL